jgi:hypothetical protein
MQSILRSGQGLGVGTGRDAKQRIEFQLESRIDGPKATQTGCATEKQDPGTICLVGSNRVQLGQAAELPLFFCAGSGK